jgi:hypothetical protein
MSMMGHLLHINSSLSNNNNHTQEHIMENFTDKKAKNQLQSKNTNNENTEQKFSIRSLLEKSEVMETHKKAFFVLSDEVKDDEDDLSVKLKRDLVVNKLMYDKSIILDKHLQTGFNDKVLATVYLALSNESRKLMTETVQGDFNNFHSIIGFKPNSDSNEIPVNNETIINLCNYFIRMEDCKLLFIYNVFK